MEPVTFFQRGQRGPLPPAADPGASAGVDVEVWLRSGRIRSDVDVFCLCLGADGRLGDDRYFVFYNQRTSPEGAVWMEPLTAPPAPGTRFRVEPARLPGWVERVVVGATIDGPERMAELEHGEVRVGPRGGGGWIAHEFRGGDFAREQAVIVAELYRKGGQWRFWAVSQGFEGGLERVLEHFGAEVRDGSVRVSSPAATGAASAGTAPARTESTPPVHAPAPPVVVAADGETELQWLLYRAPAGSVLRLPRNEYQGPAVVDRPLSIEGDGSTVWGRTGPVLRVASPGVRITGVEIETTALEGGGDSDVALSIAPGCAPELHGVRIRGRVVGLEEEAGEWALPGALSLGSVAPRHRNEFRLALRVPVECRLSSSVSGVRLSPETLRAGDNEVSLLVEGVGADTLIAGEIVLHSPRLQRAIALTGSTVGADASAPVGGLLLWSPAA